MVSILGFDRSGCDIGEIYIKEYESYWLCKVCVVIDLYDVLFLRFICLCSFWVFCYDWFVFVGLDGLGDRKVGRFDYKLV